MTREERGMKVKQRMWDRDRGGTHYSPARVVLRDLIPSLLLCCRFWGCRGVFKWRTNLGALASATGPPGPPGVLVTSPCLDTGSQRAHPALYQLLEFGSTAELELGNQAELIRKQQKEEKKERAGSG